MPRDAEREEEKKCVFSHAEEERGGLSRRMSSP